MGDTMSTVGDTMSAPGDVQCTRGLSPVQWGYLEDIVGVQYTGDIVSTPGAYHDECGGYHEYTGGCSVHRGIP